MVETGAYSAELATAGATGASLETATGVEATGVVVAGTDLTYLRFVNCSTAFSVIFLVSTTTFAFSSFF